MGKEKSKQNTKLLNSKKVILDLCGGTGSWSRPYKEAGYTVINLTLPMYDVTKVEFTPDGKLILFPAKDPMENLNVKSKDVYGILAAPPCTMFSFARTTAKTPRDFEGAMRIVESCMQIIWTAKIYGQLKFWAMENPTGYLRRFIGKPSFKFYQWQFGGYHVKATDIWGYFNEPTPSVKTKPVLEQGEIDKRWSNPKIPDYIKEQLKSTGERRAAVRAITPEGFARAFHRANK